MIEKITRGQFVSTLIPAMVFTGILLFTISPIIPPLLMRILPQPVILFLLLSLVVAFSLSGLNIFLFKIIEGYLFLERFPFIKKRQELKASKLKDQIVTLQSELNKLVEAWEVRESNGFFALQNELYDLVAYYELNFPPDLEKIVSTRFGNILRASEYYSGQRYGIDAVTIWPRLFQVIPRSYQQKIEQSSNGLGSLVYCVFLSFFSSIIFVNASLYQFYLFNLSVKGLFPVYFIPVDFSVAGQAIYSQRSWLFLGLSLIMILLCFLFYSASLPVARMYGILIRGAFDLFRFDLLKQLNIEIPRDSYEEYDLWAKISESFAVGDTIGPLFFDYHSKGKHGALGDAVEINLDEEAYYESMIIMPAHLRQILIAYFSESELRDICFDSNIDFEILPGSGKSEKARELIIYFQRRGNYPKLVEICKALRPSAPWN